MTKTVMSYFNIFECGRNLLERIDVIYQQAFMATPQEKYYNALLNNLVEDNNCKGAPLSNKKFRQEVGKVMEETEVEFERNINEITCDT